MRWGVSAPWCPRVRCVPHPSEEVFPETARETLAEAPAMKAQGEARERGTCPAGPECSVAARQPAAHRCATSLVGGSLPCGSPPGKAFVRAWARA